jgi:hypothetical protein
LAFEFLFGGREDGMIMTVARGLICGEAVQASPPDTMAAFGQERNFMEDSFLLGDTEFGLDRSNLKLSFLANGSGQVEVTISLSGDETTFQPLSDDEDGPWSWALYPPVFHLAAFRMSQELAVAALPIKIPERAADFEMALYMMEYCEMRNVVLQRLEDGLLVEGLVDVFGEEKPLRIQVARAFAA